MKKTAVFVLNERFDGVVFRPDSLARLEPHLQKPPVFLRPEELDTPAARTALAEAEFFFCTWGAPKMTPDFLRRMPSLRAVFYGAGSVKSFITPEFWERDILLCSAWQANAVPVAEFSLGAILLSLKKIWSYQHLTASGDWSQSIPVAGAYHSTVGLVSLGAIGRRVAQYLQGFEIRVLAYDPYLTPAKAAELGVEAVSLEELFVRSDVISLHIPWLAETEKMINRSLLEKMKPQATLINTARGAVLDEEDLAAVWAERPDLTALLDVTWPEPPAVDSPLRHRSNIYLTPHIAGSMPTEWGRMGAYMIDECLRHLRGEPLQHQVRPEMLAHMA
jgi:phosphoglycerate dehydrogenase-like enzyme